MRITYATNPKKADSPRWRTPSLDLTPDANGNLKVLENNKAIQRSVINLILIDVNERMFNTNSGAGVYKLLFENDSEINTAIVSDRIYNLLSQTETRIVIEAITVEPKAETNEILIEVAYAIVGSGVQDVAKTSIYIN